MQKRIEWENGQLTYIRVMRYVRVYGVLVLHIFDIFGVAIITETSTLWRRRRRLNARSINQQLVNGHNDFAGRSSCPPTGAFSTDIFMMFTKAKQIRMAHSIYDILRRNTFERHPCYYSNPIFLRETD